MRPLTLIALAALALAPQTALAQNASAATIESGDGSIPPLAQQVEVDGAVAEAGDLELTPEAPLAPLPAEGLSLDDFLWIARPIVVFADTPADPRFIEQMELLAARPEPLLERDVVIIVDTDPAARSAIRTALRPRGFSIVVVAKDGTIGLRRPAPRDVREIIRAIDNFQLRQEELRQGG